MEPQTPYLHSGVINLIVQGQQEVSEVRLMAEPEDGTPNPLPAHLTTLPKDSKKFLRCLTDGLHAGRKCLMSEPEDGTPNSLPAQRRT